MADRKTTVEILPDNPVKSGFLPWYNSLSLNPYGSVARRPKESRNWGLPDSRSIEKDTDSR